MNMVYEESKKKEIYKKKDNLPKVPFTKIGLIPSQVHNSLLANMSRRRMKKEVEETKETQFSSTPEYCQHF